MGINYQAVVSISAQYTGEQAAAKARKDLENLDRTATGLSGRLDSAVDVLKTLASAWAVKEAVLFGKSIVDMGDQLNDLHQKTGISVQGLSSLKSAAEDSGLEFGSLQSALQKFAVSTVQAGTGSKEILAVFKSLGVNIKDANGQFRSSGELILEVADKFKESANGPEKAQAAVKLFGKAGAELIPLLNLGRESIEGFGLQISDDFARRADTFNDTLNAMKRNTQQLGINLIEGIFPALQQTADALVEFGKQGKATAGDFEGLSKSIKYIALIAVGLKTAFVEGGDAIFSTLEKIGTFLGEWTANQVDRFSTMGQKISAYLKGDFDKAAKLSEAFDQRTAASALRVSEATDAINEGLVKRTEERVKKLSTFYDSITAKAKEASAAESGKKGKIDTSGFGERGQKIDRERDAIEKYRIEQQKTIENTLDEIQVVDKSAAAYLKQKIAREELANAAKATVGFEAKTREEYFRSTQAIIEQKQALVDLTEERKRSFGAGALSAFSEYVSAAQNTAAQTKNLFSTALKGVEDSIVKFVKTGKLSFADLAAAIEESLIRIAVQKTIAKGLSTVFGSAFADGGVMTSGGAMPLRKYAGGGVASSPQVALFGEGSRPEAYVPLPDGRSIPVTMKGAQGGQGNTSVQVNVTIAKDGSSSDNTKSDSESGKLLGNAFKQAVLGIVLNERRPGGSLA